MVFFNYATMQMAAKIVYYGPGLCGKTTNLHHIYAKTSPQSRGEMVSLETETDRTLFFDLLPIDVGVIGGFKTRLQLYTIPGQVFYNTTRKLVLKGVDGIVFVADSQGAMQDANIESFNNLRDNLREIGLSLDDIPLVLQLNKRDLPNVAETDTMLDLLDSERKYEWVEAVASGGNGVFETLKLISKLTLRTLRRRMTGEEAVRPARRGLSDVTSFRVKEDTRSTGMGGAAAQAIGGATPGATARGGAAAKATGADAQARVTMKPVDLIDEIEEIPASDELAVEAHPPSEVDARIIADAPVAEPPARAATPAAEPEIDFNQTEKQPKAPEVKHVKVRSGLDIMAELEGLRKRATSTTPKAPKKEPSPLDKLLHPRKRELHRNVMVHIPPGTLPKAKSLRLTVSFENDDGVLQTEERTVDLSESGDAQTLSVNLKFEN